MGVAAGQLSLVDLASQVVAAREERPTRPPTPAVERATDRAALVALESSVAGARDSGDGRPSLVLLAACLADLGAAPPAPAADLPELHRARDDWLRRLRSSCRSESALVAYRVAIDDLLEWAERNGQRRLHRRRRSSNTWTATASGRSRHRRRTTAASASCAGSCAGSAAAQGVPDPFLDLEPPPKPRQDRDWLTTDEFRLLLEAAEHPERNLPGLVERDRLALLTLVMTGLRRSELCALDWRDLELDGRKKSLLVRNGKGGKPRRQPCRAGLHANCGRCATRASRSRRRRRLLRPRRRPASGDDPRRHHPPGSQARRDREARDRPHAPPHCGDVAPSGARRHTPRR